MELSICLDEMCSILQEKVFDFLGILKPFKKLNVKYNSNISKNKYQANIVCLL